MWYNKDMETSSASSIAIELPREAIIDFCQRWKIIRLELFGSVLRDDFQPTSDVDVLVTFAEGLPLSLLDIVHAEQELSEIVGRRVDLVERPAVEKSHNWIRREAILSTARPFYDA
jgi:hypothetical protein